MLAPTVTRRLIASFAPAHGPREDDSARLGRLTRREEEILRLVARGMSNGEIAAEMFLSEATVKTHVGRLLRKLDCRDRVQAVVFAFRAGFVTGD